MDLENIGKVAVAPRFEDVNQIVSNYLEDIRKNVNDTGNSFNEAAKTVMERFYNPKSTGSEVDEKNITEAIAIMRNNIENLPPPPREENQVI